MCKDVASCRLVTSAKNSWVRIFMDCCIFQSALICRFNTICASFVYVTTPHFKSRELNWRHWKHQISRLQKWNNFSFKNDLDFHKTGPHAKRDHNRAVSSVIKQALWVDLLWKVNQKRLAGRASSLIRPLNWKAESENVSHGNSVQESENRYLKSMNDMFQKKIFKCVRFFYERRHVISSRSPWGLLNIKKNAIQQVFYVRFRAS